MKNDTKTYEAYSCLLTLLDMLKLYDTGSLDSSSETLSEMMFRKMESHGIDLNKELGFDHLKPIKYKDTKK
jgi:hypothetical protein